MFSNKTVIVTGAAGQIGSALVTELSALGNYVVAIDKCFGGSKNSFIDDTNVSTFACDISNSQQLEECFNSALLQCKQFDVLVNNAGVSTFEDFLDRPEKSIDLVMSVNLKSTLLLTKLFGIHHKEKEYPGSIVNIASHYGIVSPDPRIYEDGDRKNSEIYGATKAGIIQMTKYYAVHLASYGVRVNSVSPGGVYNPVSPQNGKFIEKYSFRCPLGRMARVDEIIPPILFLSSEKSPPIMHY